MQFAEYSEIKITGIDGIQSIITLSIKEQLNEHAKARLSLLMEPDVITEAFYIESGGKEIQIQAGEKTVFCGYLTELQDHVSSGVHTLEAEVSSYSQKLDLVQKKRSFQEVEMSYAEVAERVLSDYEGAAVAWENGGACGIGYPLFQYGETDWEFIRRIASISNQGIIPNVYVPKPYLLIDLRQSGAERLENYRYLEYGVAEDAYHKGKNLCKGEQREYEYHKILCDKDYTLGSLVSITEGVFRIVKKETALMAGEVHFYYTLAGKSAFLQKTIVNKKLCGLQLGGIVTKTVQDKVKVSLDIDKNRAKTGGYYFDWHPISSSIMYAMPEEGERVNLCIDNAAGQNMAVINCIRSNGSDCADTSQSQNSLFQYQSQKMKLFSDKLSFTMNEGMDSSVMLELLDTDGIMGQVMSQVQVTAQEAVLLKSKEGKVTVNTPCKIEVKDISEKGATLSIHQTIECFGQEVQIQAYERISYAPFADAPLAVKRDWKKLGKKVLAAAVVVAVVAAVAASIAIVGVLTGGAAIATIGSAAIAVVKVAAIGGAVCGAFAVGGQVVSDVKNGTKRDFLDYVYMGVDQFCTGAILAAPMAVPFLTKYELIGTLAGTGICSLLYQLEDMKLDAIYGNDFYDEDSHLFWTLFTDVLFAGVGNSITKGLKKGFQGLEGRMLHISKADVRKLLPYWNRIPTLEKIPTSNADINSVAKETMRRELSRISQGLADSKLINFFVLGGTEATDTKPAKPGADIPTTKVTDFLNNLLSGVFYDFAYGDDYDEFYNEYRRVTYSNKEISIIDFDEHGNLVFE